MSDDKRSGSIGEFLRVYAPYVILAVGLLFFVAKEKIAGGLPAIQQAVAGQQRLIDKQREEISELKANDKVSDNRTGGIEKRLDGIDAKLDRLLSRSMYGSASDDRGGRMRQ